ncbi:MAG: V-type ATPase subunit [Oscillospiraceae bacterium]|nr:V-type ATPase subunit [Oscillospiraceae bacterium]
MKDTDYTYAVARIRANELSLLSAADLEQLIAAPECPDIAEPGEKLAEAWRLITEILPAPGELDFLIVRNDFHNLKALLKSIFTDSEPGAYFMRPSVFDPKELREALREKRFDRLPACMAACAEEAYALLAKTMDGQLADAVVDRQCLETTLAMARATGNAFAATLAEMTCAFANARIQRRAEKTGKGQAFLERALCACPAAVDIPEEVLQSGAALEKYCDDALLEYARAAKAKHFGPEPLIAYFLAREAEAKSLRVVLTCRKNGVPADEIRRRVRLLYV